MGDTHEVWNKKYFAELIASVIDNAIDTKIIKTNTYGYDVWYGYEITIQDQPYAPQKVCTPFELDVLTDMGYYGREVDVLETTCDFKIAWDPGRPTPDTWLPKTIPSGATLKLENKKISKIYIHALTEGTIYIEIEGFVDC